MAQTQSQTLGKLMPKNFSQVFLALLASFALVFSFAVPASAATTVTGVVLTTGGGAAIGPLAGGTEVTITGTGFPLTTDAAPAATYIKFGEVNALEITPVNATTIRAKSPPGTAGIVAITVAGAAPLAAAFTYAAAPTVTAALPASGPLGGSNSVVITGTNFLGVTGVAAVKFDGINATSYVVNSATQITAIAPARAAGAVNIVVTAAGGQGTGTNAYTYVLSPPVISSINVTSGSTTGGTTVLITGTNFHGVSTVSGVKFGSTNATSIVVNSPTQITAVSPAGVAGTVPIFVTAVDGTTNLAAAFTYRVASAATSASERIFFVPGRSEIRSSQYEAFAAIALATEGKSNIRVTVTSRRWSGSPASLGKARNTSVIKLLELLGLEGANVTYTRFNTKATAGGVAADKNNRVTITVSWTN
jgi:hypothetical protein